MTKKEIEDRKLLQTDNFKNSLKEFLAKKSNINFNNLSELKYFPVCDNAKTINKNIFLCGDALFTFPPSFAQGASQSIETAYDIFKSITSGSDNVYKKRISKIALINWRSKINHFVFHLSNPLNILLRNLVLKYLTKNKKFLEVYLGKIYRN